MTICKVCKEKKCAGGFYSSNKSTCKVCVKQRTKNNYNTLGNGYDFTFKGVIRVLYKTMKRHQELRGHGELPFTKKGFKGWALDNDYQELYTTWKNKGYLKEDKPSVDRLDDFKGYSFTNMRLVTWVENKQHQASDILTGEGTSGTRCHKLQKLDNKGCILDTYTSYQEVRRLEGYCVHYALKNNLKCKKGFYWKEL